MYVRPGDAEAGEASAGAADAPLKPPPSARLSTSAAAAQAVSVALVTPRGRATLILGALLCLLLGASLLAPPIQDAVLSVHLHPPAAEVDAAAAARAEVARADLEAKLVTAPRTHGKLVARRSSSPRHRAHKSKDAGAKDKLRQMRLEHDAEKDADAAQKDHHDHDVDEEEDDESEEQ